MDKEVKKQWDASAKDYQRVYSLGQNDYNASLVRFWQDEGMLRPGMRVIDVGCGVGKYGVVFAEMGCDVTLTDISSEMLRLAEENMSKFTSEKQIFTADFNDLKADDERFKEGFDFSISTMSPAIHDIDTVKKFSVITHGTCFVARFSDWEQPFRDILAKRIGAPTGSRMTGLKEDCSEMLRLIKEAGYEPSMRSVEYNWEDEKTPEEMADYLYRHDWRELPERDELREKALKACKDLAGKDGKVCDNVNTTVAWIYWKTV